jgi:hypothetical protein
VTDASGRPVSGLSQDDFEIVENKQSIPISTFLAVNIPIDGGQPSARNAMSLSNEAPHGRLYVIALDTMPADMALRTRAHPARLRRQALRSERHGRRRADDRGLRDSGQEFTSNRRLLLTAIDKFDGGIDSGGGREKNFMGDFRALMEFMATLPGARKAVIFASQNIPGDPYMIIRPHHPVERHLLGRAPRLRRCSLLCHA